MLAMQKFQCRLKAIKKKKKDKRNVILSSCVWLWNQQHEERVGWRGWAARFSLQVGTDQVWQGFGNGRAWGLTSPFISI